MLASKSQLTHHRKYIFFKFIDSQGLLIVEISRSHSDTPHSVGLLWRSDRPVAAHNTRKRQTFMPPAGFEPAIPASELQQTHALERDTTEIGTENA